MNCKDCEYYIFKNTKDRPLCCCGCELSTAWNKLVPDLPGYNLAIKVLDWLNVVIGKIIRKMEK